MKFLILTLFVAVASADVAPTRPQAVLVQAPSKLPVLPEVAPAPVVLPAPAMPVVEAAPAPVVLPAPAMPEVIVPAVPVPDAVEPDTVAALPTGEVYNDGTVSVTVNAPAQPSYYESITSWFSMVINYFNNGVATSSQQIV